MSGVAAMVTCALCGTRMSADTQYCPKCGSLNAHYNYSKSPSALIDAREAGDTATSVAPEPVAPADTSRPRRWRAPVQEQEQVNAPQAAGAGEMAGQPAWQYGSPPPMGAQEQNMQGMFAPTDRQSRPDIDLDARLPVARRHSVVHVPPRALLQSAAEAESRARMA